MSRSRRLLLCAGTIGLLLALPMLAAAAAKSHKSVHHPQVGLGDDNRQMFGDPRFLSLGIKLVRYDMHWDALSNRTERAEATAWLKAAHAHHLDVLVTIDHSDKVIYKKVRVKVKKHGKWVTEIKKKGFSQTRVLPSPADYGSAFKAFRRLFPWVHEFVTWDETNSYGEATYDKEGLVAEYYRTLRHDCPSCTILAAEFLDVPKIEAVPMTTWAKTFVKDLGYQPGYWGLNNYVDANNLQDFRTRSLLDTVKGNIWLAETGGIVNRRNHTKVEFPQNASHAAKVDRYLLDTIGSMSPRIQRIYLYEWEAHTSHDSWDSALISYNNLPRPGYDTLAETLDSWGIRPDCELSRVPPACKRFPVGTLGTGPTGATGSTAATGATGAH